MSPPDSASIDDETDLEEQSGSGVDPLAVLLAGRDRFVAFVRGRVGSPAFADDVVQSAFTKALEQQAALRDTSHATAWFYRILRNEIVDQVRRTQAHGRKVDRLAGEEPVHVDPPSAQRTPCRCVLSVLASLKGDYAGLIQVVDIDGVPVTDAAALFGITANNASVRLHRARAALRDGLAARCGKCALEGCGDCSCRATAG